MYLPRAYDNFDNRWKQGKALIISGPRRVGKTTLVRQYLGQSKQRYRFETGDDFRTRQVFESQDLQLIRDYVSGLDIIAIDEAQRIKDVGYGIKLITDHIPDLKVIATGSASFALAGQVGEPLTGRKLTLSMYPVSILELSAVYNPHDLQQKLNEFLIYGTYPEILVTENKAEKIEILKEITGSYLLKDILEMDKIKSHRTVVNLLKMLALQVGNEVSFSELGRQLQIDNKTVARYVDLFEKAFIVYPLSAFSRNLRNELIGKNKYYFYDNGIRNALISNFNSFDMRNDTGSLWENFMVLERIKRNAYKGYSPNLYFWRTYNQKEIDMIEERDGGLFGYEFKWGKKISLPPKLWTKTYNEASYTVYNPDNYLNFVMEDTNPPYCPPLIRQ
ncbi:MAG: ATP-binding protein [Bacteroidota bacterium]